MKQLLLVIFCSCVFLKLSAQDTIRYYGCYQLSKKDFLIVESIELYPNGTFKWTSEYDLSWIEYGNYQLKDNRLKLDFTSVESLNTKLAKTEHYQLKSEKMYRLNKLKLKKRRKRDRSVRTFRSWFSLHRHKYFFKKG